MHISKVLLTIDVESLCYGDPQKDILGKIDNTKNEYGIPLILEILKTNDAKATFYLNVYESAKFGDEVIKKVARLIVDYNQDLQLHTHPETMFENKSMASYDLKGQERIINVGKALIYKWTGKVVNSHRAGNFSGNSLTLEALSNNEFLIDSSLCPVFNSPLNKGGYSFNDVLFVNNIIEIPITYFRQFKMFQRKFRRFLDIESCSLSELKVILNKLAKQQYDVINIIMHSFSFTRFGKVDFKMISKFEKMLKYINQHQNLILANSTDIIAMSNKIKSQRNIEHKKVPCSGMLLTYTRAISRIRIGWKNFVFVSTVPIAFLILFLIILMF